MPHAHACMYKHASGHFGSAGQHGICMLGPSMYTRSRSASASAVHLVPSRMHMRAHCAHMHTRACTHAHRGRCHACPPRRPSPSLSSSSSPIAVIIVIIVAHPPITIVVVTIGSITTIIVIIIGQSPSSSSLPTITASAIRRNYPYHHRQWTRRGPVAGQQSF